MVQRSRRSKTKSDTTAAVVKDAPQRKARNSSKVKTSTQKQQPQQPTNSNRSKGKKTATATAGGQGGSKGKGNKKGANKTTKKEAPKKPLTAEQLDKQMDDYMMRNEKTAEKVLEDQMDDYWAQKGKKDGTAETAPDEGEVNE